MQLGAITRWREHGVIDRKRHECFRAGGYARKRVATKPHVPNAVRFYATATRALSRAQLDVGVVAFLFS